MNVELMHAWRIAHKHAAHHRLCAIFSASSCIDSLSVFNVAISPLFDLAGVLMFWVLDKTPLVCWRII